jgi:acetolactate synthase-1/2/3 large subunit
VKRSGGEIVTLALEHEGVELTFGIPGTHNIELYDALGASRAVRPVLVTDEQSASFMADGLWRATGRLGCVNVVPGAGLTHALSGIAEAFLDQIPMLVLGCGIRRDSGRSFQLHDVDQAALAAPVVKAVFRPKTGAEAYGAIRAACEIARTAPGGPVFVEIPADLYLFKHETPADLPGAWEGGALEPPAPLNLPLPDAPVRTEEPRRVEVTVTGAAAGAKAAVELLGEGRPLLYLGMGSEGAGEDLVRLAEALESPVATTFQGKGVFPETHPLWLWPGVGEFTPPFTREVAGRCDLTLAIGCRFSEVGTGSYGLTLPEPIIHVDLDPDVPGRNYPTALAVTADGGDFVRALLEGLEGLEGRARRTPDAILRSRIREGHVGVWDQLIEGAPQPEGVTPALLIRELQSRLGPEAVFTMDSGNGTFLGMEILRLEGPGRFLAPVDYSCMGYSVPAALGAALGGENPVAALAGDGAFLMTGLELLTAAREGIPAMVFLLRDRELAQISQFQETAMNRKVSSDLAPYEAEYLARGMGVEFLSLPSDRDVERVVGEAAAVARSGRPVLVDVAIDYSRKTFFTRGVVKTNLLRLPLKDRLRMVGRAVVRRVTG